MDNLRSEFLIQIYSPPEDDERTMELIEVTARFAKDGKIYPQHFSWQSVEYPVESTGRRWRDQDGLHMLVMVPGDRVLELILQPEQGLWYLKTLPSGRQLA